MRAGAGGGERSVGGELLHQIPFVFRIEVIGVGADELDHLAVALGRLPLIAARLIHAGKPLVPIRHLRIPFQELPRGLLGFIHLTGLQ